MDKIGELKNCVHKIAKDVFKFFEKNNMASGVRARKKLQNLKIIAQEIRILIQGRKKDRLQKKKAKEAASIAIFAGQFLLRKKTILKTDIIKTHKGNDFFKIRFSIIRLCKNFNRYRRILSYINHANFFLERLQRLKSIL